MLSNAYFLAKFRFDTAENEPAKNLQDLPTLLTLTPNPIAKAPRKPRSSLWRDLLRGDLSDFHQLLHLGDGVLPGGRHRSVEVVRRPAVDLPF